MSIWNSGYQSVSCVYREKALDKVFLVRTFNNLYFPRYSGYLPVVEQVACFLCPDRESPKLSISSVPGIAVVQEGPSR